MEAQVYVLTGPGQLELHAQELPETLEPTQMRAETLYSAISPGTELAAYTDMPPLRPSKVYPRLMGYCNMARITETGAEVKRYQPGDYLLSFQSHRSHFVIDEEEATLKLPTKLSLEHVKHASTAYLFHLSYSALLKGPFQAGMQVAVIGGGTLGYTTAQLARYLGGTVALFTNQDHSSLQPVLDMHVRMRPKTPEGAQQAVIFTGSLQGFDMVINTSNRWQDWHMALEMARHSGTIINLGFPGRGEAAPDFNPLDSQYTYDKQLTIKAAGYMPDLQAAPQDVRFTIKRNMLYLTTLLLQNSKLTSPLVQQVRPWQGLDQAYQELLQRGQQPPPSAAAPANKPGALLETQLQARHTEQAQPQGKSQNTPPPHFTTILNWQVA